MTIRALRYRHDGQEGRIKMIVTYSDGLGLVSVTVDHSGITCDGQSFFFTDANSKDYKIPCANVFSIVNE